MSSSDDTPAQDAGPDRLNPAQGAPTLDASVEATGRATDLCAGHAPPAGTHTRILVWLAEGAREVTWALCSLPRERWVEVPPARLSDWPALRHARHLALRERHVTLPIVRSTVAHAAEPQDESRRSTLEFEQADAAWDPAAAIHSADAIVRDLGETRFELLSQLESAPDEAWQRPISGTAAREASGHVPLDWLLLDARQHELEHLAAIWRIALHWDRVPRAVVPNLPLHPADRLEESH